MRILVFGDSITQGFWDKNGGWVNQIRAFYDARTLKGQNQVPVVFNLGISGDWTDKVSQRIEAETKARTWPGEENAIVLAVGINDSILMDNIAQQDVYEFQEKYEALVDKAKSLCTKVLCVGLTAVDEKLTDPWGGSTTGKQWLNNRINLFEDAIKQVSMLKEVDFIGVHDDFLKNLEQGKLWLSDGLHPNSEGHKYIAKQILPALDKIVS